MGDRKRKGEGWSDGRGTKKRPRGADNGKQQQAGMGAGQSQEKKHWVTETVDKETAKYFAELAPLLQSGGDAEDPEDRAILIANALEEAQEKEVALACDPSCSRVIETLLSNAPPKNLIATLGRLGERFVALALHPAGSHSAEALLTGLHKALQEEDGQAADVARALQPICKALASAGTELLASPYGSHTLRTLLKLLRGGEVAPPPPQKGGSGGLLQRLTRKSDNLPKIRFPELLRDFAKGLLHEAKEALWDLCAASHASAALQALVRSAAGDAELEPFVFATLLGCDGEEAVSAEEGMCLENANPGAIQEMMEDRAASHLVEAMVSTAGASLYSELWIRFFKGVLPFLAMHPSANFCVQALLIAAQTKAQVEAMLNELEDHVGELLGAQRGGVVVALVAAVGRCKGDQKKVCSLIASAVSKNTSSVASALLHLDSTPPQISLVGATLLQTILNLPEGGGAVWWEGVANLDPSEAVAAAGHSAGSRALEAFLEPDNPAPSKHKHRLITKLQGSFVALVRCPAGSFCVEAAFNAADFNLKEVIVSELAGALKEVETTRHGPVLLHKWAVRMYAEAPDHWRQHIQSREGLRQAFNEFLGDPVASKKDIAQQGKKSREKETSRKIKDDKSSRIGDRQQEEKYPDDGEEKDGEDRKLQGILSTLGVQVKAEGKKRSKKKHAMDIAVEEAGLRASTGVSSGEIDELFSGGASGQGKQREKGIGKRIKSRDVKQTKGEPGDVAGLDQVMKALAGKSAKKNKHG